MDAIEFSAFLATLINREDASRFSALNNKNHSLANLHGDRGTALRELRDKLDAAGGIDVVVKITPEMGVGAGELFTLEETAKQLGISRAGAYAAVVNKRMAGIKIGSTIYVTAGEIERYRAAPRGSKRKNDDAAQPPNKPLPAGLVTMQQAAEWLEISTNGLRTILYTRHQLKNKNPKRGARQPVLIASADLERYRAAHPKRALRAKS